MPLSKNLLGDVHCANIWRALCFLLPQGDLAVFSSSNVAAAYAFAARAHEGQVRKNGEPVLTHLVATARILAELGLPEEVVAAGLLHDVLCDTPTTASQLSAVLPHSVVSLVTRVSQLNQLSQNYRDNTHSLEAEAMLDMLTGGCSKSSQCTGL
jgi:GTP pyrophosphokinase